MPYPSKLTAGAIVAAAIAQLDADHAAELSLRGLALGLTSTPHALYRYFADRAALEAAVAAQSYADLLVAMQAASKDRSPTEAVRDVMAAYLTFARTHPARYRLMLAAPHDPATKSTAQHAVWAFVMDLLARLTGVADNEAAALALWALLHGIVALTDAGIAADEAVLARGIAIFRAGLSKTGNADF
ncbi:MAG: WHG domain-containing protein [Ktedonobacterales bacterium]|nr:WHG domain-containing protein [Ktedonobacterales bacterium]